jgi:hypothetical protein
LVLLLHFSFLFGCHATHSPCFASLFRFF